MKQLRICMKQLAKLGTVAMKEIKKNKKHEQNKKTLVTGERDKQTCHRRTRLLQPNMVLLCQHKFKDNEGNIRSTIKIDLQQYLIP